MSGLLRTIYQLLALLAIRDWNLAHSGLVKIKYTPGGGNQTYKFTIHRVRATDAPTNPLIQPRGPEKEISDICGYSTIKLVQSPLKAEPEEFPWLGALFQAQPKAYICTVNLITTQHVLTAAHCLMWGLEPKSYQVVIGYQQSEPHRTIDLSEIRTHPLFEKPKPEHDFAILTLNAPVEISAMVRPVCLTTPSAGAFSGMVAGFGPNYTTFNKVRLPLVGHNQCRYSNDAYRFLKTNENSFCAGERNSLGACSGDSGAGFLQYVHGRMYLIGVVSTSLPNNGTCNLSEYIIFASLKNDLEWLRNLLQEFLK